MFGSKRYWVFVHVREDGTASHLHPQVFKESRFYEVLEYATTFGWDSTREEEGGEDFGFMEFTGVGKAYLATPKKSE